MHENYQNMEWDSRRVEAKVLYVSINQSGYVPHDTIREVEPWIRHGSWCISADRADQCYAVVPVFNGEPVGMWEIEKAYQSEKTWRGGRRAGIVIGEPYSYYREVFDNIPNMRRGVAIKDFGNVVGWVSKESADQ